MRTLGRWAARLVLGLALLLVVAVAALLVAARTAAVRELVRARLETMLARATGAEVRLHAVGGTLGRTFVVDGLRVAVDGRTVVRVPHLEIVYALWPLFRREVRLARVTLVGPRVRAVRTADGWRLPPGSGRHESDDGQSKLALTVERLTVLDGRIAVAFLDANPARRVAVGGIALDAAGHVRRGAAELDVRSLRFVPRGVALSPVTASARVGRESGGPVRLAALQVATARTRIDAAGTLEHGRWVDARARVAPLAAADVRALVPTLDLTADVRAHARVRGPWSAIRAVARADAREGGTLWARTTIDAAATPPRYEGSAAFAGIDPGAIVTGLTRASMQGELRVRGEGVDPKAPIAYRLTLHDSDVAGRLLERVVVAGQGAAGRHRLHATARAPAGDVALRAALSLETPPTYRMSARWTLARLDLLLPSAWGWAAGRVRVAGRGRDPATRRASLDLGVTSASLDGMPITHGDLRARVAGNQVEVDTLSVLGPDVRLDGSGKADLDARSATMSLAASADLGVIGAYTAKPLGGRASVSATATGALDALAVEATATVDAPASGSVSAAQARLRADLHGLGGTAPTGHVRVEASAFRLRTGSRYEAHADADWNRRGSEDRVAIALDADSEEGRKQALALTLARVPGRTSGKLETVVLTPPEGPPWQLAEPAEFVFDSALSTRGIVVSSGPGRVVLSGRIGTTGASDAVVTLERLTLEPLCELAGMPPCGGELSGRATLTGTAFAPVLDLSAQAHDLAVGKVAYGVSDLSGHYADRKARLHATVRHPQAGELQIDGDVPVDLAWAGPRRDLGDAPIALTARADRLDLTILQALAPHTLKSSAGRLRLDVEVRGRRAAPSIEGQLALDDGRLELAATGVPYEEVRARITAHGTHVAIEELHARGGDGTLDVTGAAEVSPGKPPALDVHAHLHEFFAVRQEAYEAALSGDVAVAGTLGAPDVSGALEIDRAVVRPAGLPASGPTIPHDPTIKVAGAPEATTEGPPSPGSELAGPLKLSLKVAIARNAWIRRNDADIELGGEIHLVKPAFDPLRITGQINLLRGWYAFQGRRFTLEQGTITFTGASPPKPLFDITAVYTTHGSATAGGYRIEVRVTGSVEKPTLTLSSDPPLEQADILSVLLFGKPAQQLGKGQSVALQQQALQLAAGYVMPELRTSVMDALGVDTLEVDLPQGTEAGRVSAGRYVAEDVFVSLGQEFGRRVAQVVGLEYSLGANVSVRASTSTRGNSAIDLLWQHRY